MGVNRFSCHVMKSNFRAYGNHSEYASCTVGGQMFFRVEQVSACRLSSSYG